MRSEREITERIADIETVINLVQGLGLKPNPVLEHWLISLEWVLDGVT